MTSLARDFFVDQGQPGIHQGDCGGDDCAECNASNDVVAQIAWVMVLMDFVAYPLEAQVGATVLYALANRVAPLPRGRWRR